MNRFRLPDSVYLTLSIALLIVFFSAISEWAFPLLSLERAQVAQGQIWRIFTSNFVHFGWAHTLMNVAAFLLCAIALLNNFSIVRFTSLLVFCSVCVGTGVYVFNPEYETYAGLSGAIHGLIIAGLFVNKRHNYWVNGVLIAAVFAKIIHEHQSGYQANDLQNLLPVAVAYDAHLYGAIAGLVFGLGNFLWIKRQGKQ